MSLVIFEFGCDFHVKNFVGAVRRMGAASGTRKSVLLPINELKSDSVLSETPVIFLTALQHSLILGLNFNKIITGLI